eukprot:6193351-Pleurochrysis_carterae.AAC.2
MYCRHCNVHDGVAAPIRPITPVTDFRTRTIGIPVKLEPNYNHDKIYLLFAVRLLSSGREIDDYAAYTEHYTPPHGLLRPTTRTESCGCHQQQGARNEHHWYTTHGEHLPSPEEQHVLDSRAATLPEEFRKWNRDALEQAAQRRASAEGAKAHPVSLRETQRLRPPHCSRHARRKLQARQEAWRRTRRRLGQKSGRQTDPTEAMKRNL